MEGGKILRITPEGQTTVLVKNLPSQGDYHTNGPAIGPDGSLYFSQGVVIGNMPSFPESQISDQELDHLRIHRGIAASQKLKRIKRRSSTECYHL